jgi:broad specificity phosphatase PhoE
MVKVYFVRHGETFLNVECKLAGQIETELTENGKKQADETGKKLFEMGVCPDVILCSPYKRAVNTAGFINQYLKAPIEYKEDLKEINFGDCEGVHIDEVKKLVFNPPYVCGEFVMHNGVELRRLHDSFDQKYNCIAHPNGESKEQARNRFSKVISLYLDEHKDVKTLLIVAHGSVMRNLFLQVAPHMIKEKIKNGQVLMLNYETGKGFFA